MSVPPVGTTPTRLDLLYITAIHPEGDMQVWTKEQKTICQIPQPQSDEPSWLNLCRPIALKQVVKFVAKL